MLLACGAYALATVCQLLLDESLTQPSFKLALRGASLLGATVLYAMVSGVVGELGSYAAGKGREGRAVGALK